jgi:hypothetical protein
MILLRVIIKIFRFQESTPPTLEREKSFYKRNFFINGPLTDVLNCFKIKYL